MESVLLHCIRHWLIATPILSWFGIVLGAKSYLFAHRVAGSYTVLIGILAFMFWLARVLGYIPADRHPGEFSASTPNHRRVGVVAQGMDAFLELAQAAV